MQLQSWVPVPSTPCWCFVMMLHWAGIAIGSAGWPVPLRSFQVSGDWSFGEHAAPTPQIGVVLPRPFIPIVPAFTSA